MADGSSTDEPSLPTVAEARPDLAVSLAEAQRAEQPLAQRVAELEAELAEALRRSDYLAAQQAKDALPRAREAAAIAAAHTSALQAAVARLEEQRRADLELIEAQRRREQAERDLEAAQRTFSDAQADKQQQLAAVHAGVEAVRQSWKYAEAAQQVAASAQLAEWDALKVLGHVPADQHRPRPRCDLDAVLGRDPVLRMIILGQ